MSMLRPAHELSAADLPFVTTTAPVGGVLKAEPAHFVVEEVPLYAPSGSGEHVYLRVRRSGRTTHELARALARLAGLPDVAIGYAGLKDKHALVTQTFSLTFRGDEQALARRVADQLAIEVLDVARHGNKLRRGHLVGNCFEIVLAGTAPDGLATARACLDELERAGIANFYGEQRLGERGANARRGARELAGDRRPGGGRGGFAARFALNAFQSALFNRWLAERIARGWLERVLTGDVAKKTTNGALFDVLDEAAESERALRREIVATGPMYGVKMRAASGAPGALEDEVLRASGATADDFARARLGGSRRAARVFPADLAVEEHPEGLRFAFRLPKGAYATVVMREITKERCELAPPATPEEE